MKLINDTIGVLSTFMVVGYSWIDGDVVFSIGWGTMSLIFIVLEHINQRGVNNGTS